MLSSLLPSLFLRLSNVDSTDSAIIWLVERGKYSCCTSGFLNVCRFLQNNNAKLSYLWFWREWMFYESNESMRLTVNIAIIYWLSLSSRFSNKASAFWNFSFHFMGLSNCTNSLTRWLVDSLTHRLWLINYQDSVLTTTRAYDGASVILYI